jgi:hypothetical protein
MMVFMGLMVLTPSAAASGTPYLTDLIADGGDGTGIDVGDVTIWNEGTTLYVEFDTTGTWVLSKTHMHIAGSVDNIPHTKKGNPIPGKFDYKTNHDNIQSYTYSIDLTAAGFCSGDTIFVATHADVKQPIEGCYETVWQIGDVESLCPNGYLTNYANEFNWKAWDPDTGTYSLPVGDCVLGPGLNDNMPAYTNPFIVGTTPTNEFPYNSNTAKPYATDIDVKWNGALEFGGKLTVSWSPGASATEKKLVVGDELSSTTFTAYGANTPGQGWFVNKYPLVQHTADIGVLPEGEHLINFKHTQGDGTFWDWIRLEQPCIRKETAWGDGDNFDGSGWGMHFSYTIQDNNPVGDWVLRFIYGSGNYDHDMTVILFDETTGYFEGEGGYPAGQTHTHIWQVTGTVTGDNIEFTIVYQQGGQNPGYTVEATGTIAEDGTLSGTWYATGQPGPYNWESLSGAVS